MKRVLLFIAVFLAVLCIPAFGGCTAGKTEASGEDIPVEVTITRDFGRELMLAENINLPSGTRGMEALKMVADVETAYGGGFVEAINGLSSDNGKHDWFIYANGMSTNAGALSYNLQHSDRLQFDFRDWSYRMFIPAITGAFPEPFLHGYEGRANPLVIVYQDTFKGTADELEAAIRGYGVDSVYTRNVDELTDQDRQRSNLMVIGTPDCELIEEVNRIWSRLGFFVHFDESGMTVHNSTGGVEAVHGPGWGVLQATQSPWNPRGIGACQNVVWVISGTDVEGVNSAAGLLLNWNSAYDYSYAMVTGEGNTIRVPN